MSDNILDLGELDGLLQLVEQAPEIAIPHLETAMTLSVALLHDSLAEYPPATEANQPGRFSLKTRQPMGYYERGRGWWYPVKQKRTLGARQGKRLGSLGLPKHLQGQAGAAGYRLSHRSERLGTKWRERVMWVEDTLQGEIGTNVSYARFVQGDEQNHLHSARNWKTAGQVLEENTDQIIEFFGEAAEKIKNELAGGNNSR